jgi:RNase P protein component
MPRCIGGTNLFHVYYSPMFAIWRRDREQLTPRSIFYPKLIDSYENMRQDTLRWQVVANTAIKEVPKAVMRERLRRRIRGAFGEALEQLGYDSHGRVLPSGPAKEKLLQDIRGTLEIHCRTRVGLDVDFAEIVRNAHSVINAIVESKTPSYGKLAPGGRGGQ